MSPWSLRAAVTPKRKLKNCGAATCCGPWTKSNASRAGCKRKKTRISRPSLFTVPAPCLFNPMKELPAIEVADDQREGGNPQHQNRGQIMLVPDASALNSKQIGPGHARQGGRNQKRAQSHRTQAEHITEVILGKSGKQKQHKRYHRAGVGGQEVKLFYDIFLDKLVDERLTKKPGKLEGKP